MAIIDHMPQGMAGNALVLCSTARLARSLRMELGRIQRMRGATQWQPPTILTLSQWLDDAITRAMLAGELPADYLPRQMLDNMAERLLWERAIEKNTQGDAAQALFDMAGLAQSAAEANRLLIEWNVHLAGGEQTEETRQFLRWRETFQALCRQYQTLEAARYLDRQIDAIQRGVGSLPAELHLAGFDRFSPQEKRLLEALTTRGVQVLRWPLGFDQPASAVQIACDDAEAECRAAVAWAARRLAQEPQARLAIVAPELGVLRARLLVMLDDALHPASIHPARAEMPRSYDFSLGDPLSAHSIIACALSLLRLSVRRYRIPQQDAGMLLRDVHWSAGVGEADARARLEARMRSRLSSRLQLEQLLRLARKAQLDGLGVARLVEHLEAISVATAGWPRKQSSRAWAAAFAGLLKAAGWPGERSLSSHEFQARQAWDAALNDFDMLDALLGPLDAGAALHRLSRLVQERIFQPEAEGEPRLLVMGMLEAAAAPLDAMWVLGMNDHQWPPPPRPNPLLPAEAQRRANAPNACSGVQTEFAQAIHARLMHGAAEIVFSWSHRDGERELRPSPLLSEIPQQAEMPELAATLAERLAQPSGMQWLDDHVAPPVAPGEIQRGGTGLLKAQAICPAWAYYQYRLGARALDEPVEGLDALARGNLLHMVLQAFWTDRTSADLHAMDEAALGAAIGMAVEAGIRQFVEQSDEPLPPQFAALEKLRLQRILAAWLELEKTREPFSVLECERRISLDIDGLQVNLVLDRVDELPDGRLVVLDYKTGASVSHKSWAEERIAEPQLPIYAALALCDGEVAAVCFAKVQAAEQKFIGIADSAEVLPGVCALDGARKLFPEDRFPDWAALIRHWQASITAIAAEIKAGEAAVKFRNEEDLRDCDVKPLLRLPERKLQLERHAEHE
ncbi:PD-(D/E)XK nuclease family protein [Methylobacillus sp. MM3]|uniref:PD-(D/E)XK nuclease family protein n=1 Tax=Methylobacillus sp. MM3 TaxID=1848039 RepID=UPI000AF3599A|nr:PD-(D/E)XK nuclease family protein [Methylobacillus sp. MM3]